MSFGDLNFGKWFNADKNKPTYKRGNIVSCYDNVICSLDLLGESIDESAHLTEIFQIKEFGCNLSLYEIDSNKQLILKTDHSNGVDAHFHLNYTGELELVGRDNSYIATFENAKLINVEKLEE